MLCKPSHRDNESRSRWVSRIVENANHAAKSQLEKKIINNNYEETKIYSFLTGKTGALLAEFPVIKSSAAFVILPKTGSIFFVHQCAA